MVAGGVVRPVFNLTAPWLDADVADELTASPSVVPLGTLAAVLTLVLTLKNACAELWKLGQAMQP